MARKKNSADALYDLLKMNPKQAIIILIIAGLAYFIGGEGIFLNDAGKVDEQVTFLSTDGENLYEYK